MQTSTYRRISEGKGQETRSLGLYPHSRPIRRGSHDPISHGEEGFDAAAVKILCPFADLDVYFQSTTKFYAGPAVRTRQIGRWPNVCITVCVLTVDNDTAGGGQHKNVNVTLKRAEIRGTHYEFINIITRRIRGPGPADERLVCVQ